MNCFLLVENHLKKVYQKQPSRGILRNRCSENIQQIYRRTRMSKLRSKFIEITLRRGCSPVTLLHIFRTVFPKNTSGWVLLVYFKKLMDALDAKWLQQKINHGLPHFWKLARLMQHNLLLKRLKSQRQIQGIS